MPTLINTTALLPKSTVVSSPLGPKSNEGSKPIKEDNAATVQLSESAKSLASATLDQSEIGKLLSITKPTVSKDTIKSSQSGLDAYLALNKNKLF